MFDTHLSTNTTINYSMYEKKKNVRTEYGQATLIRAHTRTNHRILRQVSNLDTKLAPSQPGWLYADETFNDLNAISCCY